MNISAPQFTYILLVLPFLFGITLIGDGIHKFVSEEESGVVSIVIGIIFLAIVVLAYFIVPSLLSGGIEKYL